MQTQHGFFLDNITSKIKYNKFKKAKFKKLSAGRVVYNLNQKEQLFGPVLQI